MIKLRYKLALFNLFSKLLFAGAFLALMGYILERVNLTQTDQELIEKREKVIDLIAMGEIDPLWLSQEGESYGSYNILKEEYISLEKLDLQEHWNFIEVTQRMVDEDIIDYRVLNYSFIIDGETYLLEIGKSLGSIRQTEQNIRRGTLYFLVLFILITLMSDISMARLLIKPLEAITLKLKKTATPLDYNHIPVKTSTMDFHYLDKTLSQLMYKIEDLFQKEKAYTANISHELLTPIAILRSQLENLLMDPSLSPQVAEKIEESLKPLYRLKSLVNALLLIARIESSQYLMDESISIEQLLDEVCDELEPICADANIHLEKSYTTEHVIPKANKSLLFTMFYNVINNAIKFTPAEGYIRISTSIKEQHYQVLIADTGCGMDEQQISQLFQRFGKKIRKEENSTGIGLAITKSIADFHLIDIQVKSKIGQGSNFFFIFPKTS